jgi:site-specific recombinase XerD
VRGTLHNKQFPLDTPIAEMREWRQEQVERFGGEPTPAGSLAADVDTYLARVTAMPSFAQRQAHLALWLTALGRDRTRRSITTDEIDVVLQGWLETLAPGTVRKRRTALQSFFVKLNGKKSRLVNPVKGSENPKEPKPEARGLDYLVLERAIAAMPDQRDTKKGLPPRVNLAKVVARVIAYTGIPPGLLNRVRPHDLVLVAPGSVHVPARTKGAGVEARTLPLTPDGLAALQAFHAAHAYGRVPQTVNRSFKRGCRRAGLDPKAVRLYDLRHSFLAQLYRVTRDLATVGRLGLHAEGSTITARYAKGANEEVDAAATAAFSAALAAQRQRALPAAPVARASPAQVPRRAKSRRRRRLRAVS